ncbi:hypothetical protein STRATTON_148 [Erwinia phage vB_EamM_Stratton]|uniref:Uncharacterized protein n=1 Tax=Erwinia phage vB_EamM_Stratton TaxID=1883378 RepID=A0A1B2IH56_9CAUD|nr:hypothetical protein STRATTON_148 [Erwinia phage vB_EamM_Stratton]
MTQDEKELHFPLYNQTDIPEPGRRVLFHIVSPVDSGIRDPEGSSWKTGYLVKGISKEERFMLPDGDPRKTSWQQGDEEGNNQRPFSWQTDSPMSYHGQLVDCWMELPRELNAKLSAQHKADQQHREEMAAFYRSL